MFNTQKKHENIEARLVIVEKRKKYPDRRKEIQSKSWQLSKFKMDFETKGRINKNVTTFLKSENFVEILRNFHEVRQYLSTEEDFFSQLKVISFSP